MSGKHERSVHGIADRVIVVDDEHLHVRHPVPGLLPSVQTSLLREGQASGFERSAAPLETVDLS